MLGNPVPGRIQPRTETWDQVGFIVTSTFAEHIASGRGPGIDIGNSKTGAEVYAMADGVITFAGQLSTGIGMANVVRIWHPDLSQYFGGQRVESGYAHLLSIEVSKVPVSRGQPIGHVGMSGATAPHLHGGFKVGGTATVEGTEIDWWPLLDQNIAGDDVNQTFVPLPNKTTTVNAGARHRTAPTLDPANIAINADPGGPLKFPLSGSVKGSPANGTDLWYVYWRADAGGGPKWFYLHSSVCGPLTPFETTTAPSDCAAEITAAVTPLKARLDDLTLVIAGQNKKISDAKAALG